MTEKIVRQIVIREELFNKFKARYEATDKAMAFSTFMATILLEEAHNAP